MLKKAVFMIALVAAFTKECATLNELQSSDGTVDYKIKIAVQTDTMTPNDPHAKTLGFETKGDQDYHPLHTGLNQKFKVKAFLYGLENQGFRIISSDKLWIFSWNQRNKLFSSENYGYFMWGPYREEQDPRPNVIYQTGKYTRFTYDDATQSLFAKPDEGKKALGFYDSKEPGYTEIYRTDSHNVQNTRFCFISLKEEDDMKKKVENILKTSIAKDKDEKTYKQESYKSMIVDEIAENLIKNGENARDVDAGEVENKFKEYQDRSGKCKNEDVRIMKYLGGGNAPGSFPYRIWEAGVNTLRINSSVVKSEMRKYLLGTSTSYKGYETGIHDEKNRYISAACAECFIDFEDYEFEFCQNWSGWCSKETMRCIDAPMARLEKCTGLSADEIPQRTAC